MKIVRTVDDVRRAVDPHRAGAAIGLVPTMGALHRGHVKLFEVARLETDCVVATIFVNPAQFGDPTDLARYPRQEEQDAELAAASGVDLLFAPAVAEVYPQGFATWVDVGGAAQGLEGDYRPGHFRGVATVCLKLFTMVEPTVAFFGQKDAQQVAVLQQLVRDLNLRLRLRIVPTVRDADGLALSSRNVHLTADDRRRALAIPRALHAGLVAHHAGGDALAAARSALGDLSVEYIDVARFGGRLVLVIAARVGGTRLIDNAPLDDLPETIPVEGEAGAAGRQVDVNEVTRG
jgi:pantoate--beta-alanine ligase